MSDKQVIYDTMAAMLIAFANAESRIAALEAQRAEDWTNAVLHAAELGSVKILVDDLSAKIDALTEEREVDKALIDAALSTQDTLADGLHELRKLVDEIEDVAHDSETPAMLRIATSLERIAEELFVARLERELPDDAVVTFP